MNAAVTTVRIRDIAHRGLWNSFVPQNTVEAFRRAWEAGATWCETDFHHTRAGQMICLHAEGELRRYTGCEKAIADLTPDEVASLRLDPARFAASYRAGLPPAMGETGVPPTIGGTGVSPVQIPNSKFQSPCQGADGLSPPSSGFRIPFLHEVLATVPPHGTLQAEIKGYSPQYADLFDAAVREAGLTEANIVVSSFQFDALADFHARKPSYRTLWLLALPKNVDVDVAGKIALCRDAGFDAFCPGLSAGSHPLTPAEADAVRAAGLSYRVWGVNSPEALRIARDLGAEAFTCNFWRDAFDWAASLGGIELLP